MSNSSIWPIDRTLSGATTQGQSRPGSDENEGVLHILLDSLINDSDEICPQLPLGLNVYLSRFTFSKHLSPLGVIRNFETWDELKDVALVFAYILVTFWAACCYSGLRWTRVKVAVAWTTHLRQGWYRLEYGRRSRCVCLFDCCSPQG